MKTTYEKGEFNALLADAPPPTDDDVSITSDGRRLDSRDKVIAWLDELNTARSDESPA